MIRKNKSTLDFSSFNEAIRVKDMQSIPPDYLQDMTRRGKEKLGIAQSPEGSWEGIGQASGQMMQNFSKSQQLSRGHEQELENLAREVITDLYKPLLDYYGIKLEIKLAQGMEMKRMLDKAFQKTREKNRPRPDSKPVVKALGADFSMLIHEAVKGIWRVMSMSAVPDDPELAKAIEDQFGLMDEPDEWRYGPTMADDLRQFIIENPKVIKYKNLREELWKYMVDPENLPTEEFLPLMTGIFRKTPEARKKIDELIEIVISQVEERDAWLEQDRANQEEYEKQLAAWKARQAAKNPAGPEASTTKDYASMSQDELKREYRKADEEGDIEKMIEISEFMDL
ncbi:hypothetical protein EBS02_03435 [bacterium]|nr:hypothetical protein [bacterium]